MTEPSNMTPTAELILEVLAARHRLGEQFWTFPNRRAIRKAVHDLEDLGFVWVDTAPTLGSFRVGLTEQGKLAWGRRKYIPPVVRSEPVRLRDALVEAIDNILLG
ncbi:helix-turn-helix DNA binding domain protein [Mycobacterium phage Suarez]|nr:helix-turn-helix DNA binding domain protein [Mycobacterium phage Suarez]